MEREKVTELEVQLSRRYQKKNFMLISYECGQQVQKTINLNVLKIKFTLCIKPTSDKYFIPDATPRAIPSNSVIENFVSFC